MVSALAPGIFTCIQLWNIYKYLLWNRLNYFARFHMGPSVDRMLTICSNGSTKMALLYLHGVWFLIQSWMIVMLSSLIARRRVGSQTLWRCQPKPFIRKFDLSWFNWWFSLALAVCVRDDCHEPLSLFHRSNLIWFTHCCLFLRCFTEWLNWFNIKDTVLLWLKA